MSQIVVTGMGIISPLGDSVGQNRLRLQEGKSGISQLEFVESKYAAIAPFGEVKFTDEILKSALDANERGVTRSTLLALHAFREAINDSHLNSQQISAPDTALIVGSTVGGMCMTDELYQDANQKEKGSAYLSSYDCSSIGIYLQERYGLNGIINTINTACSSSANAIMYGVRLIQHGWARRAIVGGVDSLAKFTINGFNSLFLLSEQNCRPFDNNRSGLNLGEGAAFLVLEGTEDVANKSIYAEISGYGNSNDAFHPSSLSGEGNGPYLAMKEALTIAKLTSSDIDYINAHGTGTENNDLVESKAMLRLFDIPPRFSSTKSNTGHTLGAAGAIEAIFSILSLQYQELYPSLNFKTPIPETGLSPVVEYQQKKLQHIMSNSFGFGGNCSSLIFSRVGI